MDLIDLQLRVRDARNAKLQRLVAVLPVSVGTESDYPDKLKVDLDILCQKNSSGLSYEAIVGRWVILDLFFYRYDILIVRHIPCRGYPGFLKTARRLKGNHTGFWGIVSQKSDNVALDLE
jgi:hypothetical protein